MKSLTCQVTTEKENGNERASDGTVETGAEPGDAVHGSPLWERGHVVHPFALIFLTLSPSAEPCR